jgi:hypothetical protein
MSNGIPADLDLSLCPDSDNNTFFLRRVTKLSQVLDPSQLICHLSVADEILLKIPPRASRADGLPSFHSIASIATDDRATIGAIER